jgi:hypothetical protein
MQKLFNPQQCIHHYILILSLISTMQVQYKLKHMKIDNKYYNFFSEFRIPSLPKNVATHVDSLGGFAMKQNQLRSHFQIK